jgi:hypothetical protein
VDPEAVDEAWECFYDFAEEADGPEAWLGFLDATAPQDALGRFVLGAHELLPGTDDPQLAVRYGAMVGFLVALEALELSWLQDAEPPAP